MAHALEVHEDQAAFVSAHTDAWHQLGTTLDHTFTAEEALQAAHLGGWNVRKSPLYTTVEGKRLEVTGRKAVVRDNPFKPGQVDVLGDVGNNYSIIQNEQHVNFLNILVDESSAHFETAGSIFGGTRVFVSMKLPGHINVGGVDPVENYITAVNTHDGSMAFTIMVTPVRVVCANTLNMAFQNKSHTFRIRHTSGAERILRDDARQALDMTFKYLDGFQEEANRLINTEMTDAQFREILNAEFGVPEDASKAATTRSENRIEDILDLFYQAQTQENVRGTAWAGLNAMTEYWDHFAPTRGDDAPQSLSQRALFDPSYKNTALSRILANV